MKYANEFVTIKVSTSADEKLRRIGHELYLDTYPDVVEKLIEEHMARKEVV